MGKYFDSRNKGEADDFAIACHACLGHELPSHINPFSILEVCAFDYWPRFEKELLALWDGDDKPRSWYAWREHN